MFPLLLQFLKPDAKKVAWTQAVVIVVAVVLFWQQHEQFVLQKKQLDTAETALKNPKVVERIRTVTVAGPVRIKTVVVEKPTGERETTTEETRDTTTETVNADTKKEPVDLAMIIKPPITDRWLLGLSNLNFTPKQLDNYTLWGGYSFRNRIDLLYGVGYADHVNQNLMCVFRF